jgi:hypothetical protein
MIGDREMKKKVVFLATVTLTFAGFARATPVATTASSDGIEQPVTVITLRSATVPDDTNAASRRPQVANPIQVSNGGVRTEPGSCFAISADGNLNPLPGDCVVLRSTGSNE